ncbi:hypothetical protein [Phytohabitans kaempferiae]|uniref:Uncharacterized protein n=1 Tax=Phytohabitans kaempferiae TaxID=1620943 RepID=A0ABV6M362_9ACTN
MDIRLPASLARRFDVMGFLAVLVTGILLISVGILGTAAEKVVIDLVAACCGMQIAISLRRRAPMRRKEGATRARPDAFADRRRELETDNTQSGTENSAEGAAAHFQLSVRGLLTGVGMNVRWPSPQGGTAG